MKPKKISKLLIAATALIPTTFICMIRFDSWLFCMALVVSICVAAHEYVQMQEKNLLPSDDDATIGQLLDEQLGTKQQDKIATMSGDERRKLAAHFAKEIGSDTQKLSFEKLKKYEIFSINGENN